MPSGENPGWLIDVVHSFESFVTFVDIGMIFAILKSPMIHGNLFFLILDLIFWCMI